MFNSLRHLARLILCFTMLAFSCGNVIASQMHAIQKVPIDSDINTIKRGANLALENCLLCHNIKYVKYRNLSEIGFTSEEIDNVRRNFKPNDSLTSFTMPVAALKLYGLIPPDLSLMAKARADGKHYIYSLLLGFYRDADNNVDNHLFPGIRMPDVLNASLNLTGDKRAELEKNARDVAAFLAWASDPHETERRTIGYFVMVYLFILTILLYILKRRAWRTLDK